MNQSRARTFNVLALPLLSLSLLLAGSRAAQALPDAAAPALLGITLGAEAGFAGPKVGTSGIPYYFYGSGGIGHIMGLKGEWLGGGNRPDLRNLSGQFSVMPTPLVTVVAEPGWTLLGGSSGPSLGLRATGSLPFVGLKLTGYTRISEVNSTAMTEIGMGLDYPVSKLLHLSISAIQFNGVQEPAGTLFLAGIKTKLGL